MLNASLQFVQHWRGGRASVEQRAMKALTAAPAFGNPDFASAMAKLKAVPGDDTGRRPEARPSIEGASTSRRIPAISTFHDGSVATLPDSVVAFLASLTGDMPADFVTAPALPAAGYRAGP